MYIKRTLILSKMGLENKKALATIQKRDRVTNLGIKFQEDVGSVFAMVRYANSPIEVIPLCKSDFDEGFCGCLPEFFDCNQEIFIAIVCLTNGRIIPIYLGGSNQGRSCFYDEVLKNLPFYYSKCMSLMCELGNNDSLSGLTANQTELKVDASGADSGKTQAVTQSTTNVAQQPLNQNTSCGTTQTIKQVNPNTASGADVEQNLQAEQADLTNKDSPQCQNANFNSGTENKNVDYASGCSCSGEDKINANLFNPLTESELDDEISNALLTECLNLKDKCEHCIYKKAFYAEKEQKNTVKTHFNGEVEQCCNPYLSVNSEEVEELRKCLNEEFMQNELPQSENATQFGCGAEQLSVCPQVKNANVQQNSTELATNQLKSVGTDCCVVQEFNPTAQSVSNAEHYAINATSTDNYAINATNANNYAKNAENSGVCSSCVEFAENNGDYATTSERCAVNGVDCVENSVDYSTNGGQSIKRGDYVISGGQYAVNGARVAQNACKCESDSGEIAENEEEYAENTQKSEPNPVFYNQIEKSLNALFSAYPPDSVLESKIEESRFARVDYENTGDFYSVGYISENGVPKYICYAIPCLIGSPPPKNMEEFSQYLPIDEEFAYYLMYQDAQSGETIQLQIP